MTTYTRLQNNDLTYTGWIAWIGDNGVRGSFSEIHTDQWQQYQDWIAEGNTPEDQYSLDDIKLICSEHAIQNYKTQLERPLTFETDEIDVRGFSRGKMNTSNNSSKTQNRINKTDGRYRNVTKQILKDIIDALEDRDEADSDELQTALDAIEAAADISDLEDYLPPII